MLGAYRRYTVRPTAVPIRAALNAVEAIDPARVRRRLLGGNSTLMQTKKRRFRIMAMSVVEVGKDKKRGMIEYL